MNKVEFLKNFRNFMQNNNYANLTQTIYLADIEQFINFLNHKNYSGYNDLDFIYKLTKNDFTDFIAFLKENHIYNFNRKYFAIKLFALFLYKNYSLRFIDKIYKPKLLNKEDKININNFITKTKDIIINNNNYDEKLISEFIIFYLSIILNIPNKKIINLNNYDIKIYYDFIILLNRKIKCNKDFCFIFKYYLEKNNSSKKIFKISYQAFTAISRNFLLIIKDQDNTIMTANECSNDLLKQDISDNIINIYKKIHPRS